jgi:vitamin K-dependent gamma-carboxylase-like protein
MKALVAAWNRFWFEPVSTATIAVMRIAFGALVFVWALTLLPDLRAFYTSSGILPQQPHIAWTWGLLQHSGSMTAVVAVWCALLVGSIGVMLGYRTRLSSLITFVTLLAIQRRNPWVINTGDWFLRMVAFYILLTPAGAALSLDRWRTARDDFWEFPHHAPWGQRLIQIQLSAGYLFSVWAKVQGTTWNNGTAVSYALRIGDFSRFAPPGALSHSLIASNILTFGSLATELSLVVLVWNRRCRPWVLAAGIVMHLLIDVTLLVGFFSYEIFIGYVAFVPEGSMEAALQRLRTRIQTPPARTAPRSRSRTQPSHGSGDRDRGRAGARA